MPIPSPHASVNEILWVTKGEGNMKGEVGLAMKRKRIREKGQERVIDSEYDQINQIPV